jgi:hypothetical protein
MDLGNLMVLENLGNPVNLLGLEGLLGLVDLGFPIPVLLPLQYM